MCSYVNRWLCSWVGVVLSTARGFWLTLRHCRLGDRHGENILFEEGTGGALHVDFNCLFDKVINSFLPTKKKKKKKKDTPSFARTCTEQYRA